MKNKPKLGQHFLRSESALSKIIEASKIIPDETIIEIGPGEGVLTEKLLSAGAHVIAIEKDSRLFTTLEMRFANALSSKQLILINGDILNFSTESLQLKALPANWRAGTSFKLVANIPYYITGEILRQFLSTSAQPSHIVLLIQKEVAERIVARDGKESILSLSVKCYGEPSIVGIVKAGSFVPPPNVDSAILVIKNISKQFFTNISEEIFFKVVKSGFSHKRKLLLKNLLPQCQGATLTQVENIFSQCKISLKARAEDISLKEWELLATEITKINIGN